MNNKKDKWKLKCQWNNVNGKVGYVEYSGRRSEKKSGSGRWSVKWEGGWRRVGKNPGNINITRPTRAIMGNMDKYGF